MPEYMEVVRSSATCELVLDESEQVVRHCLPARLADVYDAPPSSQSVD